MLPSISPFIRRHRLLLYWLRVSRHSLVSVTPLLAHHPASVERASTASGSGISSSTFGSSSSISVTPGSFPGTPQSSTSNTGSSTPGTTSSISSTISSSTPTASSTSSSPSLAPSSTQRPFKSRATTGMSTAIPSNIAREQLPLEPWKSVLLIVALTVSWGLKLVIFVSRNHETPPSCKPYC